MWSRKYDECIGCGTTEKKHMAKGLCVYCYSMQYQTSAKNSKRVREQKRQWAKVNGKYQREKFYFAGQRDYVLERDNHTCRNCGSKKLLVVHHIGGNGRGASSVDVNNDIENLVTLCRGCHAAIHSTATGWSRHYDACIRCGTTAVAHNAKGLCVNCYSYFQYHSDDIV